MLCSEFDEFLFVQVSVKISTKDFRMIVLVMKWPEMVAVPNPSSNLAARIHVANVATNYQVM